MEKIQQTITGNNNIQVAGDLKTEKIIISTTTKVIYDKDLHITDEQAAIIQEKIKKIASERTDDPLAYPHAQNAFKKHFKTTSYKILPKEKYDEAITWLNQQIAMNRKGLRKSDNEQWRKDMYKAIHTRAREFEIDIHSYATGILKTKTPVVSLSELSDSKLQKLYDKLFSIN